MKYAVSILLIVSIWPVFAGPNHLTPIPAYDSHGYNNAVFESLIGNIEADLWMIVRPSFSNEYAIILHRQGQAVRLDKVAANKTIWAWKQLDKSRSVLDIKPTLDVTRQSILLQMADAEAIVIAWEKVLKTTRYPENEDRGQDGTTYHFYSHHQLFGQTWSPTEGLPLMVVNLGKLLEKVIEADKNDRQQIWVKTNALANKIIDLQP